MPTISIVAMMPYSRLTSSGWTREVTRERVAEEKPAPRAKRIVPVMGVRIVGGCGEVVG